MPPYTPTYSPHAPPPSIPPCSSTASSRSLHTSLPHYYTQSGHWYSAADHSGHLASLSQRNSPPNSSAAWYGQNYPDQLRGYQNCQQNTTHLNRESDIISPISLSPRTPTHTFSPPGYQHTM